MANAGREDDSIIRMDEDDWIDNHPGLQYGLPVGFQPVGQICCLTYPLNPPMLVNPATSHQEKSTVGLVLRSNTANRFSAQRVRSSLC